MFKTWFFFLKKNKKINYLLCILVTKISVYLMLNEKQLAHVLYKTVY